MNKLLLTIFCLFVLPVFAQVPVKKDATLKSDLLSPVPLREAQHEDVDEIFQVLEKHISGGSARSLIGFVGSQIFLDMAGGKQGYFSSNQALPLLENFFVQHKPLSFKFTSVNQRAPSPFATGKLEYQNKGKKESTHVYVALTKRDSLWVMTQFTIY